MKSKIPIRYMSKLVHSPDLILYSIKYAFRKRLAVNLDYNRRSGFSKHMRKVNIKITNACNLRCDTCAQWGEAGYMLGAPSSTVRETVPLHVYKRMVDDLSGLRTSTYIWGGEPFLYPDLIPLLSYMKQGDMMGSVITNGVFLGKNAEALVDIGWDAVVVSLDGPRDLHDSIRGRAGTYDKVLASVKTIQDEKSKRGRHNPFVSLYATVSKKNTAHLEEIFDVAEEMGVDLLLFHYAWFTTEEIGHRHEEVMKRRLGVTPKAWKGYLWSFDEIDTQSVVESIRRINSKKYSFHYLLVPDLDYEDIPRYYQEPDRMFGYERCVYPWMETDVMPNGDVAPCRDHPDYVVGNIKEDSILDIWNNERYRKFRNAIKEEGGLFPICARCCGLMGW